MFLLGFKRQRSLPFVWLSSLLTSRCGRAVALATPAASIQRVLYGWVAEHGRQGADRKPNGRPQRRGLVRRPRGYRTEPSDFGAVRKTNLLFTLPTRAACASRSEGKGFALFPHKCGRRGHRDKNAPHHIRPDNPPPHKSAPRGQPRAHTFQRRTL